MIKYLNKHIDKLAHCAIGTIVAFIIVLILTCLNATATLINVIVFITVTLLAFWKEMVHDNKDDELDALAIVDGAIKIIIIITFFILLFLHIRHIRTYHSSISQH